MSFAEKLKNRIAHVKQSLEKEYLADDEVIQSRISICESCPRLLKATMQCKECGCFVKLKAQIKTVKCPINKW